MFHTTTTDYISIRAPAKGATVANRPCDKAQCNFNPRSREGSDTVPGIPVLRYKNFNPRSREGSDPEHCPFSKTLPSISIRAPAKGATLYLNSFCRSKARFQSALPRRERQEKKLRYNLFKYFNPRSREGSDRFQFPALPAVDDFNPRSREGSDVSSDYLLDLNPISIRAPAKGATFSGKYV